MDFIVSCILFLVSFMKKSVKFILKITGASLIVIAVAFIIWFISGEGVKSEKITWGVTFSPRQTEFLGLDARNVFAALLDDMKVRHLRLMAPWNEAEKERGEYDFSQIDWQIEEAQKRGAQVILAVGRKLFRWPECHEPEWAKTLPKREFEQKVLNYLQASIEHFRQYDNIAAWQVENEPLLPFGDCADPKPNWDLFVREVKLVRSLDSRPIISTESGELSAWLKIGSQVDSLGVSLYRLTNNPVFGRFYYPFRPGFYQKKANFTKAINQNLHEVILSELQLEPWGDKPLTEMSRQEQFDWMSLERTKSIIDFASHTGFGDIYIWGAEWWYWLKTAQGDNRFWELGKEVVSQSRL